MIPVRIHECEVTGLLGQVIYIDLVGRDEDAGRKTLLAGVRSQRAKPELAPAFPEKIQHTVSRQLNFPGDLPPIWNVPYPRNSLFVGREQTLQDLHTTLSTQHRAALAQLSTGSGPGNIGARETAVEYTYRYQSDYHIILWVNASSRQTLTSDFMSIVSLLNLPEKSSQEQDRIVSTVKRWLETHAYWLLVLDDAQDAALIKEFIPSSNRGHLLLTTRTRSMETLAPLIEMDSMKPEEQTLLLQLSRTVGATLRSSQRQLPLGLEQIAIGRMPDNQVVLSDPSVSSHHAEIHLKEQRYWITDLGSTNGTFVNSQRLDPQVPCLLDPGNIIRIGNTTFTYEVNGTPESKLPAIPSPAPAHTWLEQNVPATPASKANVGEHVGQRFGNYQLVRLLGQGGFGEIYLGEHVYLDTQAAIKVLHTKLANEDIENFRQEARTIARLITRTSYVYWILVWRELRLFS
jgi:pSer/pThr/pTyr-binding forkhead associated (FHA) protein